MLETSPAPAEVIYLPSEPGSFGKVEVLRDEIEEGGLLSFDIFRVLFGGLASGLEERESLLVAVGRDASYGLFGRMRRLAGVPERAFKRSLDPFILPSDVDDTLMTASWLGNVLAEPSGSSRLSTAINGDLACCLEAPALETDAGILLPGI